MKKFLTAAAFAIVLAPALANAASSFDPGADNAGPTFVAVPAQVNSANAAAAAADAQRYAQVGSEAVIGTHGASPRTVVEYDPGADAGTDMVTKTILPGAAAPVGHISSTPYADNSDVIGW